jgi:hypothetical protein
MDQSNSQLVSLQKDQKKLLKLKLKFQRRVHKLETRISHAISRKDPVVEARARSDLEELLQSQAWDGSYCLSFNRTERTESSNPGDKQNAAIEEVTLIFRQLLASLDQCTKQSTPDEDVSVKQIQNSKARNLLQHMTKGTQTSDMFRDVVALRGYVRKKFHGRAALIIKSLDGLSPEALQMAPDVEQIHEDYRMQYQSQRELMTLCYHKLSMIERVCSIGCGPGNDAVGLIAFLLAYLSDGHDGNKFTTTATKPTLKEVLLLDFAIDEWKEAALNDLIPILQPHFVEHISCENCDVTKPLVSTSQIELGDASVINGEPNNPCIAKFVQSADMFLTSYLLSETRYNWDVFFVQLVQLAPVGSLFYFAEPMAWQLHRLVRLSSCPSNPNHTEKVSDAIDLSPLHRLKFVWIDSSMHYPALQQMDGRAGGPAVLLAIKS